MKQDKINELRNQDTQSLEKRLLEISKELVSAKMDYMMGKLKNVHTMKNLRKERAIIRTIMTEK